MCIQHLRPFEQLLRLQWCISKRHVAHAHVLLLGDRPIGFLINNIDMLDLMLFHRHEQSAPQSAFATQATY